MMTADLFRLSQEKQADVTDKLGLQVRRAAEALVNAISRANRNTDGKLLTGVAPREVYAGVVTVLMRTVFLLNAEERDLVSSGDLWDRTYSVSALLGQLDDDHYRHQGVMRRRHGAWLRLLAAARAVHGGVNHSQLNVPAYGGNLFDPARHPFLEGSGIDGEVFDVGVVDDASSRHVLDLLQRLNGQRLSYRTFSVEQIGQVYESLLDHSAVSVPEDAVVLGLVGTRGSEAEVNLAELEQQHARGKLADWLAKNHDSSSGQGTVARWQARIDHLPDERVTATLAQACNGNADILGRLEPFASLLRIDARNVAMVSLPGDVYVTETPNRRDSGTAYTSPVLAADIAHHALEHLVYEPGPHNEEDETQWRVKRPGEILDLRVCDPAVGSGAILVAAVRFLADKLVESRLEYGELTDRDLNTAAADPLATDPNVQARRDIVAHCVYAVDRDPMAVEMAKLSLWLITMARGRPFTFLDHAIKCGDSLLGITSLDELRRLSLQQGGPANGESTGTQDAMFVSDEERSYTGGYAGYLSVVTDLIAQSRTLRKQIRSAPPANRSEAEQHAKMHLQAEAATNHVRLAADAITAACLSTAHQSDRQRRTRIAELPALLGDFKNTDQITRLSHRVGSWKDEHNPRPDTPRRFFHWPIEFPEVFDDRGGFDCIVGNPPFLGAQKIIGPLGEDYRQHLSRYVSLGSTGIRGKSDLVGYFIRRSATLSHAFGLIATSSIWQGDTRETALDPICSEKAFIYRADSLAPWPGAAGVHVAKIWWRRGAWPSRRVLDGVPVEGIDTDLYPATKLGGRPLRLPAQTGVASPGPKFYGGGLRLSREEAEAMIRANPRNREVLYPYCNGSWINASPSQRDLTEEWVIHFHDWSLKMAQQYREPFEYIDNSLALNSDSGVSRRANWWRFQNTRPTLVKAMRGLGHVLVFAEVSSRVIPLRMPARAVYGNTAVVVARSDWQTYGLLSSTIHRIWADRYGSALGTGIRYTPRTVYDPFPQSEVSAAVASEMEGLDKWRGAVMTKLDQGVTALYGRYHDPTDAAEVIAELRERHRELDRAVLSAFGWEDMGEILQYGHQETRFGIFYSLDDRSRYELLERLLLLNFRQAAEQTGRSLEAVMREARPYA